jgi:RNA 3'-terminal phosphate cyclase (ATP)
LIEIDGSHGEGGGQILRTSLALAALLRKKIRVYSIRQGRPEPGLKSQHLASVRAIAEICSATVEGLNVGSTNLVFDPGPLTAGSFRFDVGTAGSISLVLQTLMPVMPFLPGESHVQITGGTDVKWSPPTDYVALVMLPILRRMGYEGKLEILRRGYYPKGGGEAVFHASPVGSLNSIQEHERDNVHRILGVSHSRKLPTHVATRQSEAAERVVSSKGLPRPEITIDAHDNGDSPGPGSGIVLSLTSENNAILGADNLGERGIPAEEVGEVAAERLVLEVESRAFLDQHMGDIIVPYLVLAKGVSEVTVSRVTPHLITNLAVAKILADVQFNLLGQVGKRGTLRLTGIGLASQETLVSSTK